jgi:hypothetical protein
VIGFNQTWCIEKPLPDVLAEPLPDVRIRDASRSAIAKYLGEYEAVVEHLFSLIPEKRHQVVSITSEILHPGRNTCLDIGWHLDGRMQRDDPEHYALVCFGDDGFRTMFCADRIVGQIPVTPTTVEGRHQLFGKLMQRDLHNESGGIEIPNGQPVVYTTFDFHKGRQVITTGRRVLIRVMSSNLIKAKPFSFR